MTDFFIALADIHSETGALAKILREHRNARAIFAAGDITNFGMEKEAHRVLSVFAEEAPDIPLFFIAGNCDSVKARDVYAMHPGYLERRYASFYLNSGPALQIIGAGGGILHTGITPYELRDEELESNLSAAYERCPAEEEQNLVVVTHTPPRDTFADMRQSRHLGSSAYEVFLYRHEPLLWLCGHIHESRNAHYEGRTLLVNPGPVAHGCYALLAVEKGPRGLRAAADLRAL